MAVQRRLAHPQLARQGGRGDTLGPRLLQHGRQGLQNLLAPLTGLQATARDARLVGLGGLGIGRREFRHIETNVCN